MQIRKLEAVGSAAWDDAVTRLGGQIFHTSAWQQVCEQGLGIDTLYLCAEQGGVLTGLLPMGFVRRGIRHDLVSLPMAVQAGVLSDDEESVCILREAAVKEGRQAGAKLIELRAEARDNAATAYAVFRKALPVTARENYDWIPAKQRAEVRKALNFGLEIRLDRDIEAFSRMYDRAVQRLGTPGLGLRPMRAIARFLSDNFEILWVTQGAEPVAAVLFFTHGSTVLPYYAAARPSARDLRAYPFAYAQLAQHFASAPINSSQASSSTFTFDFGRSPSGSGAFSFKKNFGFEPIYLNYERISLDGAAVPQLRTSSPAWAARGWQVMPHCLTRCLVPVLRPYVV